MSIDMDADAEIFGNTRSPIDPKTPRPETPEEKFAGLKSALGLLLDEVTELRARVAAIESKLSDDGR